MTIYRCDKCGKEMTKNTDLYRIRVESETYDDRKEMHCWKDKAKSRYFDVCVSCMNSLISSFVMQFDSEDREEEEE